MTKHILTINNYLLNPVSEFLVNLSSLPTKIANSYSNHRIARRTIKELEALTDKELNDIGIGRCDIYYIAHNLKDNEVCDSSTNENLKGWV